MFYPIDPFTIVSVSTYPCVEAFSANDAHIVISQVLIVIAESLITFAMSLIVRPLALIHSTYLIDADALAVTVTLVKFTSVKRLFVTLDRKICSSLQFFEIEKVSYHLIHHILLFFLNSQVFLSCTSLFLFLLRPRNGLANSRLRLVQLCLKSIDIACCVDLPSHIMRRVVFSSCWL